MSSIPNRAPAAIPVSRGGPRLTASAIRFANLGGGLWGSGTHPTSSPVCSCGAGIHAHVHAVGCDPQFIFDKGPVPKPDPKALILPAGVTQRRKPRRRNKRGETRAWPKSYRLLLSFSFTRPVNIALWKRIKAPQGWRKNPTSDTHQKLYRGVRFQCTDLKYALTPDAIEELRAKLYFILKEEY